MGVRDFGERGDKGGVNDVLIDCEGKDTEKEYGC